MVIKNGHFLKTILFSLMAIVCFQGNVSSIMAHSLNVDDITVPEIRTKKDKALRVLRAGAIVTTIGVSFIALGVYGLQHTPPSYAIGTGVFCMTVTTIGLTTSVVGIVKVVKENRRKKYAK